MCHTCPNVSKLLIVITVLSLGWFHPLFFSLEQLKTSDGVNLTGLKSFLDLLQQAGIEIKKPAHLAEGYVHESIRQPYLSRLIKNLENRFDDKSVMAAFGIFNPVKLPKIIDNQSKDELNVFMDLW